MPRPKNNILHELFEKRSENKMVCNNGNCNCKVLNSHSGNLERHLKLVHPDLYSYYIKQKCAEKKPIALKTKACSNKLNRANIELAIVDFFTKNGRPLLHKIEDCAFKMLVQPAFDILGIRVSEHNINERIIAFAQKLRTDIIKDTKGKLLSLKIDVATAQDLSVLGINVQYIKNMCIQTKTLAVKEIHLNHTTEYLKSVILDVLAEYAIDINQIFTITTDNGANMLKAAEDSNTDFQISVKQERIDDNFTITMDNGANTSMLKAVNDLSTELQIVLKEEVVDNTVEDEDVGVGLIADKMESILCSFSSNRIAGVRCGAHTLQLCVHDVIKKTEIKTKIEKCRSLVKMLRTQIYLNILKNERYKKLNTDCVASWSTTFEMLENLLEIKDLILIDPLSSDNTNLYLSTGEWNFMNEFIETFKPIHVATKKLQSDQMCFSELYIIIMDILFQVESLPSSEMKKLLVQSLNKRKAKLFDNELINAAVFLDPRIKICMNAEQVARAKKCITYLYKRKNSLKGIDSETIDSSIVLDESMEEPSTSNRFLAKSFSEFLQNLDPGSPESTSYSLSPLETDFMMYEMQSRLPLDSNIIDYWSVQKNTLSVIADIILAIPSTQVSVERLFTVLNYIRSDQRNRSTVFQEEQHVLMVHANGVFNYED